MINTPYVQLVSVEQLEGPAKAIYDTYLSQGKPVPKWVQVMANNPDVLVGFFQMFKATMDDSPLPKLLKWKIAQLVSDLNKCEFCLDVTNAQLKQFGLSDEQISQIQETADEKEQVAMEFARLATEQAYRIPQETIDKVKNHFSDAQMVELAAVIGLFNYINRFNDSLGVLPG